MSKNLAYDKNKPVEIELGIIGMGAGFKPLPVHDSLLSFKYSLLSAEEGDENQFTFVIELINPVEEFEVLLQEVFSKMYADAKGLDPGQENADTKLTGYPKLLIRWGYGQNEEDGRSQVHIAALSNVNYRFTSAKEKVLRLEAKDMLGISRQLAGASYIQRTTHLLDSEVGGRAITVIDAAEGYTGPARMARASPDPMKRKTCDIVFQLLKQMITSIPGSIAASQYEDSTSSRIETLIQKYSQITFAKWNDDTIFRMEQHPDLDTDKKMAEYHRFQPEYGFREPLEKWQMIFSQIHFLRKLGFQVADAGNQDERFFLVKYALVGGSGGIVTNLVSPAQLGDNTKFFEAAATETNSELFSNLFNKPLYEAQRNEGLPETILTIGTDITDFNEGDMGLGGTQVKVQSSLSDLSMGAKSNGGSVPSVQVILPEPDSPEWFPGLHWKVTPTGAAILNPIANGADQSSTFALNSIAATEGLTETLLKGALIQENDEVAKLSVREVKLEDLSPEEKEIIFGSRDIPVKNQVWVSLVSPAGETPFETVEKVIGAFNRYLENRFNQYSIYTVPANHLNSRNISMESAAKTLLNKDMYEVTFLIASYSNAIYNLLDNMPKGANKGKDPETMKIHSFEDINMIQFEKALNGAYGKVADLKSSPDNAALLNPVYASEWVYLNYGAPNSIVKFFDFTSEFWYLFNYYRGVLASRRAKNRLSDLGTKRITQAIFNIVQQSRTLHISKAFSWLRYPLGEAPMDEGAYRAGSSEEYEALTQLREINSKGSDFQAKLNSFLAPEKVAVTFSVEEFQKFDEIVKWATNSVNVIKPGGPLVAADVDVLKELVRFYNSAGGESIKSLFSTQGGTLDDIKPLLIDINKVSEIAGGQEKFGIALDEAISKGLTEKNTFTESLEPMTYVLEETPFSEFDDQPIAQTAKTDLLATRLLNSMYQTQIRVKTLGIPEMDTVNEIYKRSIFFVARDISRERYLDMGLKSRSAKSSRTDRIHWLSGQYRPIGIVHTITPSEGYVTELKMYRDIRAVEGLTDSLQSAIEDTTLS